MGHRTGYLPSWPLLPTVQVCGGIRTSTHYCGAPQPPHVGPWQVFWAIQDLTHCYSPMSQPDIIGLPFVKMAKITDSEPHIRPVVVKILAFRLVPGPIHPQGKPKD